MAEPAELNAEAGTGFPWPPRPNESIPTSFARTWVGGVFRPKELFSAMPSDPGLGWPLLYYMVIGVVASAADFFWRALFLATFGPRDRAFIPGLGIPEDMTTLLISFLLSPVLLLVLVFFAAAVIHILLMMVGGARHTFWATFGVVCFAYSPQLFSLVPFIGGLVAFVWMVVVAIIGLRYAHRTDGWRAALAVLLPVLLLIGLLTLVAVLAVIGVGILTL